MFLLYITFEIVFQKEKKFGMCLFENINERLKLSEITKEKLNITIDITDIRKIIRKYCMQLSGNIF